MTSHTFPMVLTIISIADVERLWYDFLPFDEDPTNFICGIAYSIEDVWIFAVPCRNDKNIDSRSSDVSGCMVRYGEYLFRRDKFKYHGKIYLAFCRDFRKARNQIFCDVCVKPAGKNPFHVVVFSVYDVGILGK